MKNSGVHELVSWLDGWFVGLLVGIGDCFAALAMTYEGMGFKIE